MKVQNKKVSFEFKKNDVRIYLFAIQSNLSFFSVLVPKNVNRPSKKIKNINRTIVLEINTPSLECTLMHPSNQLFYSMWCIGELLCLNTFSMWKKLLIHATAERLTPLDHVTIIINTDQVTMTFHFKSFNYLKYKENRITTNSS